MKDEWLWGEASETSVDENNPLLKQVPVVVHHSLKVFNLLSS